jgi:ADP-heptose:LPS heptosyltransferase
VAAGIVFSLPDERIDRYGDPQPRVQVRRIVVLKADHIGDFLIAARAFELLRRFFPRAHIDLICGSWNVELARKLDIFDGVCGIDLFQQVGDQQINAEIARATVRTGIRRLLDLQLGAYDLAIDLRHDPDSRAILPALDARIYAGFGSSPAFPFLDIRMPMEDPAAAPGHAYELVLGRRQFHRAAGPLEDSVARGQGTGDITAIKDAVEFALAVEGAKSPVECGTSTQDVRELGVALIELTATPLRDGEPMQGGWPPLSLRAPHRALLLVSGWAQPENWGTWGVGSLSRLRVALPPVRGETEVRFDFTLRGHVNSGNPEMSCVLQGEFAAPPDPLRFDTTHHQRQVSVVAGRHDRRAMLACEPFRLGPGEYEGVLRLYLPVAITPEMALDLMLRDAENGTVLMHRRIGATGLHPGLCDIPFGCQVDIAGRDLTLEIGAQNAAAFEGAHIEMVSLRCLRRLKLNFPPSHTEKRLCLLVTRVALELSDEPLFGASSIAARLTAPPPDADGSAAERVRALIEGWQAAGHCVVGVALGAGKEIKRWPRHYYVDLVKTLLGLGRVKAIFIGGPADRADAAAACDALGLDAGSHAACGTVALPDLGRALQPLDLFIGNDAGTTHYAGRVGVRTVAIFSGCTHPREWGPVGDNVSWLYHEEPCSPCYLSDLKDCRYSHVCIRDLLPSHVAAVVIPEVLGVLSARQAGGV